MDEEENGNQYKEEKEIQDKVTAYILQDILSVLNKYHTDDALFSQRLWIKEDMQTVQNDWINFLVRARDVVDLLRESLRKPFKLLYEKGDEPLVYDLPDDLLGEFDPEFSMMSLAGETKRFYDRVDLKNEQTL